MPLVKKSDAVKPSTAMLFPVSKSCTSRTPTFAKSLSIGSSTHRTITSWRLNRKCLSPLTIASGASNRSEITMHKPRLLMVVANRSSEWPQSVCPTASSEKQPRQNGGKLDGGRARRHHKALCAVKCEQSHRVALADKDPCQTRQGCARTRTCSWPRRMKTASTRSCQEDPGEQVGFVLKEPHHRAPGFRVLAPVNLSGRFARQVGPIFEELCAKPVVGALVQPRDCPFDNRFSPQVEAADGREMFGIEE